MTPSGEAAPQAASAAWLACTSPRGCGSSAGGCVGASPWGGPLAAWLLPTACTITSTLGARTEISIFQQTSLQRENKSLSVSSMSCNTFFN